MSIKLDVHILRMDYTRPDWLAGCLESVKAAAKVAFFPVEIHVLPGIVGHLGQARACGYSCGNGEYVTHVDDDDFVDLDAFQILAEALSSNPEAVTTGERLVMVVQKKSYDVPESRHHLAVYRRDVLRRSDYANFRFHPDQRLLSQVNPIHLPQCVYNCRIYDTSGSRVQRRKNPENAKQEMAQIKASRLFVAEAHTPAEIAKMLEQDL